jgi:hypothetical protein
MRHFQIMEGETFRLESWGGGICFALTFKPSGRSVFVQGNDAITFAAALDVAELKIGGGPDDVMSHLWFDCEYCLASSSIAENVA